MAGSRSLARLAASRRAALAFAAAVGRGSPSSVNRSILTTLESTKAASAPSAAALGRWLPVRGLKTSVPAAVSSADSSYGADQIQVLLLPRSSVPR